nr:myb/SANT-like DNA-binding domain-containing protein 3 [Dermacentor andersoni]
MEGKKRINFSEEERSVLIDLVSKYKDLVENKRTDWVSLDKKKTTWKQITDEYNCRPNVRFRTEPQLRKCWDNLKEKWRKGKADNMKEVFTTGGGSAPASQLTDELKRVGAAASHMSTRVHNPFDSDRGRHVFAVGSQVDPSVVSLLQPMQVESLEPPDDNIYQWDSPASPVDDSSQDTQNRAVTAEMSAGPVDPQPVAPQPVAPQLPSPLPAAPSEATPRGSISVVQRRMFATKRAALEEELSARIQGVEEDSKRKKREHVLKMKLMRAEHPLHMKQSKQLHEMECATRKAKLQLLQLKIAAVKKGSE